MPGMSRRGEDRGFTEPLFRYLGSVFSADINEIDKYTPASANEEIIRELKEMAGMSQVIYDRGMAQGIEQGIAQGQNKLVEALERLHRGESREDLIASGVDEHTVDPAVRMRNTFLQENF